jgi:hypothetical protein
VELSSADNSLWGCSALFWLQVGERAVVIVFVIVGFIAGIGVGSSIVACALTDPLGAALLVAHQVTLGNRTARKAVPRCLFFVAACGVMFAYAGYSLV